MSDRGGRGDQRFGSDWLLMKSHATFAPLGPFITPKEFIPRSARNMNVRFTLNGQVMQDASTRLMIHDVFEQVAYGSNILPLVAGDVIATGSPAGVGSARNPPIFLKDGDRMSCTYEGVGTLNNPVVGPVGPDLEVGRRCIRCDLLCWRPRAGGASRVRPGSAGGAGSRVW